MNSTIVTLAKRFSEIRAQHEKQTVLLKEISESWDETEGLLMEAMIEEGAKSIRIDGIGLVILASTSFLSVNAASKETFLPYLKESGNGDLIKEDVNSRTLTAFLKGHLEEVTQRFLDEGMDVVDAKKAALDFLSKRGASYFTKREVRINK